jgi:hypothetical protein
VWDDLSSRFRRELDRNDPHAAFRGSLIDENMFAIDVNEWGLPNLLHEYRARRQHKIPGQTMDPAA